MANLSGLLRDVQIPETHLVRQKFPRPRMESLEKSLFEALDRVIREKDIPRGLRIAVTAGSRGITSIPEIHRIIAGYLKTKGAEPFIIPAMGSHGGGTPEGQIDVLRNLGITEKSTGAPIRSSSESVQIGETEGGVPVWVDAIAAESDGILAVNRIKPHTDVSGPFESGLTKMLSVGIGNTRGALACHSHGLDEMTAVLPEVRKVVTSKLPVLGGIGILENAYEETAGIFGFLPGDIDTEEPRLLERARRLMGRILLRKCELLLVERMGKDISGAGMDPNVTGRAFDGSRKAGTTFSTDWIAVFDLTEASGGNASGIGMADITTARLCKKTDFVATYANAIASKVTERLPMVLDSDRQAVAAGLVLGGGRGTRVVRVKNTLDLEYIMVSENLLDEVNEHPDLEAVARGIPLLSGPAGELAPFRNL
ncbi:MAG: lactate racemase domain-containing protein [Thermovirgaceae bacterium]